MSDRLLVPGILDVVLVDDDGRAVVELGPLADVPPADLTAWGSMLIVAPRRGAAAVSGSAPTRVRERAERARWEVVDAAEAEARLAEGPGILQLDPRREGDARITWRGADGSEVVVDEGVLALWALALGPVPEGDELGWERRQAEVVPVAERVVDAISGGAISLRDVELAQWAAGLDPELLAHEEAVLDEIASRAEAQRPAAVALAEALDGADADVDAPPYGHVRRVAAPAFELPTSAGSLTVPEAVSWVVEGVEDWEPEAAEARRQARFARWRGEVQAAKAAGKRRERRVWLAIGVLLALGLAVGVLGWLASG